MKKRLAIIDLGTNTFHLLIADAAPDGDFKVIHKQKVFVKLGEFGLTYFLPQIIERAIKTLANYKRLVHQYTTEKVLIFGTAALRNSSNGNLLIKKIKEVCGWDVQVISGKTEATFIYYGVQQTIHLKHKYQTPLSAQIAQKSIVNATPQTPYLIMDIGGGSIEFIVADEHKILWADSFDIGAALLRKQFHKEEPINYIEIQKLNLYLAKTLRPLQKAMKIFSTQTLVGASGSFDTVADLSLIDNDSKVAVQLPIWQFNLAYEDLIKKNVEERLQTPNLVAQRADMIVVSLILIKHVLTQYNIKYLYKSDYALKEGVLWAYFHRRELID